MLYDLRIAARGMRKSPAFASAALITLALGIAANTAMFSIVNTVLLRPKPYAGASDVMAIYEARAREGQTRGPVSVADFLDWRREARSFVRLAMYDATQLTVSTGGDSERAPGARVSPGFFEALAVRPLMGRTFLPEEEQAGRDHVAILTYGRWQRGGGEAVIGRTILINAEPFEIVGVLPEDFRFPFAAACDVIVPLRFRPEQVEHRGIHPFFAIGRLKPGVTRAAAQAEMDAISRELERRAPETNLGHAASVQPLGDELVRTVKPALRLLWWAVWLLSLIACSNVASLLVARAASRQREMALRAALGSTRLRLVRQSFAESALLACLGGAAGVGLAVFAVAGLRSEFFQRIDFFAVAGFGFAAIDWRVLGFTLASTALFLLLSGISPALAGARVDLGEALRAGGRGLTPARQRLRSVLVVAEVALSLMLLTGAGLLGKSFLALVSVDPGFRPEQVIAAAISLPASQYPETGRSASFYDQLVERSRQMPGVRAAAVTDSLPLSGDDNRTGVNLEGRVQQPGELWRLSPRLVTPGYLATMGIALERGRSFTEAEAAGERRVAVISATAARQLWRGEDPIGRRFAFFSPENPMYEIVGIAAPVHHRGLDRESVPEVYVPLRQNPFLFPPNSVKLVLRTTRAGTEGSGGPTAADLRTVIRALDPALPVSKLRQMETYLSDSVAPHRFNLVVLSIFAAVALALAAAGLYGLIGFLAAQRTTEIGIRMALGARQSDVLLTIMAQGMRLALAGVAVGAGCSWAAARMISKLLFGVTAHDPAIFLFAPIVLMAITSIASYVPGRRAARADPVTALRAS